MLFEYKVRRCVLNTNEDSLTAYILDQFSIFTSITVFKICDSVENLKNEDHFS